MVVTSEALSLFTGHRTFITFIYSL